MNKWRTDFRVSEMSSFDNLTVTSYAFRCHKLHFKPTVENVQHVIKPIFQGRKQTMRWSELCSEAGQEGSMSLFLKLDIHLLSDFEQST